MIPRLHAVIESSRQWRQKMRRLVEKLAKPKYRLN